MRACVYGILSICRYSSIFPTDFPTNPQNSREFKFDAVTSSPRLVVSDARDLSLILNRFSLDHDKSHLPAMFARDISISDAKI